MARIGALKSKGLSLRTIAEVLTDEKHPTKRGGRWGAETVRKVLSRAPTKRRKTGPTAARDTGQGNPVPSAGTRPRATDEARQRRA